MQKKEEKTVTTNKAGSKSMNNQKRKSLNNSLAFLVVIGIILFDNFLGRILPEGPLVNHAFWWFLVPILGGVVGAGIEAIIDSLTPVHGKNLGVLGAQGAGKTTLLNQMRGLPIPENYTPASAGKEYDSFSYSTHNGTSIKIEKGKDLPGSERAWESEVHDCFKSYEILIYIFNINLYIKDNKYRREVVSPQLDAIYRSWEKHQRDLNKVIVIGSHADQLTQIKPEQAIEIVHEYTKGKSYYKLIRSNFVSINLRDKKQIDEVLEKILNG